jgi:hypothetical protein
MSVQKSESAVKSNLPPSYAEACLPETQLKSEPSTLNDTPAELTFPGLNHVASPKLYTQINNLAWILMEIMAVTFSADVDRIKKSIRMYHHDSDALSKRGDTGLLTPYGRNQLVELCNLVRIYNEALQADGSLKRFGEQHKDILVLYIWEPCKRYGLNVSYVLEILGRYKGSGIDDGSNLKANTLVEYRVPPSCAKVPQPRMLAILERSNLGKILQQVSSG